MILAREGDFTLRASPFADIYPAAFEFREPRYLRRHNIGYFRERCAPA